MITLTHEQLLLILSYAVGLGLTFATMAIARTKTPEVDDLPKWLLITITLFVSVLWPIFLPMGLVAVELQQRKRVKNQVYGDFSVHPDFGDGYGTMNQSSDGEDYLEEAIIAAKSVRCNKPKGTYCPIHDPPPTCPEDLEV
jgi:hypothetical protein